jgi:Tetratricopeptide repeat/Protein of unknown function (DUF2914)
LARVRKSKSSLRQSESLLEQAADVAASGDLQSAESLLREALAIQEARLGSDHPALATTLNNLAIACEAIDKLPDAERFYRRAYAVALDSFDRSHPQVSTSRRNLEEFCRIHGLEADAASLDHSATKFGETRSALEAFVSEGQAWVAPAPSWLVTEDPDVEPASAIRESESSETAAPEFAALDTVDAAVSPESKPEGTPWLRIGTLGAALVVTAVMGRTWFGGTADPSARVPESTNTSVPIEKTWPIHATEPSAESSATLPTPLGNTLVADSPKADSPKAGISASGTPAAPVADTPVVHTPAAGARAADLSPPPVVAAGASAPAKAVATTGTRQEVVTSVRVMNAQLCSELSRGPGPWACRAPDDPTGAGVLYFYTRVVSASAGEIEHRWYRGDALIQRVSLRVSANPTGYRTFSRQTTNAGSGDWRVELHSADGTLIDERHFVVQ